MYAHSPIDVDSDSSDSDTGTLDKEDYTEVVSRILPFNVERGILVELNYTNTVFGKNAFEKFKKFALEDSRNNFVFYDLPDIGKTLTTVWGSIDYSNYFSRLSEIWALAEKIKLDIMWKKIVVVTKYVFDLLSYAVTYNLFGLGEERLSQAAGWFFTTMRKLPIPDAHFVLCDSLPYLENAFNESLDKNDKSTDFHTDENQCKKKSQFHNTEIFVKEDIKQLFAKYYTNEPALFSSGYPGTNNSIMISISTTLMDYKKRPLKFY